MSDARRLLPPVEFQQPQLEPAELARPVVRVIGKGPPI